MITQETKIALFEKMLKLEHLAEKPTYDNRNYFEQANGAFEMLYILGLSSEYIKWSERKAR